MTKSKREPKVELKRIIQRLTREEFQEIANALLYSTVPELRLVTKSRTLPEVQVALARVILDGCLRGDVQILDLILNRLIGKPT